MRTHKSSLSFVDRSQPVEKGDDAGTAVTDAPLQETGEASAALCRGAAMPTARADFLASNPQARELQAGLEQEFKAKFARLSDGLHPALQQMVLKAEQAREVGIILIEFVDTLPGKKLTKDFYLQHQAMFTDGNGRLIPLDLLEWLIRATNKQENAIETMKEAENFKQILFMADGAPEFQLVSERPPGTRLPTKDEWEKLSSWIENPDLEENWQKLRENPKYFVDGHLRPDLVAVQREEWAPRFKVLDELRRELGI